MSLYKTIKRPFGLAYYYMKDEVLPVWRQALQRAEARREVNLSGHFLPRVSLPDLIGPHTFSGPLIMDQMCMPPHAFQDRTMNDHDDIRPLLAIAQAMQARTIVELGTAHGSTVANLCQACPEAHVWTVNAPAEDMTGDITTFELSRQSIGEVYRRHGFESRVTQIFANTLDLEMGEYLGERKIDLGIIDACHDTEFVMNDFAKLRPFMSERGVIVLHDTHPSMRKHLFGSYRACVRLREGGHDIRHLWGTWWGVWTRNWDALPLAR
jgi:predicted O-methyltransferase YrrM